MSKSKIKSLSIILTAVMVLTLMPTAAFAESGKAAPEMNVTVQDRPDKTDLMIKKDGSSALTQSGASVNAFGVTPFGMEEPSEIQGAIYLLNEGFNQNQAVEDYDENLKRYFTPVYSQLPQDWISVSDTTDSKANADYKWGFGPPKWALFGDSSMFSHSFCNYAGKMQADNWLISESISIPEDVVGNEPGEIILSWYDAAMDINYPESYSVYIGSKSMDSLQDYQDGIDSGDAELLWKGKAAAPAATPAHRAVLIPESYKGEDVRIAFWHNDYDQYILAIDNVQMYYIPEEDTTAPTISSGSYSRFNDTDAHISFTTDEAGTAYYLAQDSGDAAPTAEDVLDETPLGTVGAGIAADMPVELTAGKQDVYVVVEDFAGNVSDLLKISIDEYIVGYVRTGAELIAELAKQDGGTITLDGHIVLDKKATMGASYTLIIPEGHALTIKENGYIDIGEKQLTVNSGDASDVGGTVFIKKEFENGLIGDTGTLNLENIKFNLDNTIQYGIDVQTINVNSGAVIDLNTAAYAPMWTGSGYTLNVNNGGAINVYDCGFIGIDNWGTLHINGGEVALNGGSYDYNVGILNNKTGLLKISNGGMLTGSLGGSVYLLENSRLEGVKDKFVDQGMLCVANGQITVGGQNAPVSANGLTEGWYLVNGSTFDKEVIIIDTDTTPQNMTVTVGSITGSLSVEAHATNSQQISYQWCIFDSANENVLSEISGATSSTFSIPTNLTEGTYYYCCILEAFGCDSVITNIATVTVKKGNDNGNGGGGGGGGGGGAITTVSTLPAGDGSVKVDYTLSGGTVTLDMPNTKINETIGKAKNGTVSIDASGVKGASAVTIPAAALEKMVEEGLALSLKMPQGEITLDSNALAKAAGSVSSGGSVTITINQVKTSSLTSAQQAQIKSGDVVLNISISAGSKVLNDLDGVATIKVPYDGQLPAGVWYLNDAGQLEKLECTYKSGFITFTTTHLSLYVIGLTDRETDSDVGGQSPFADVKSSNWFYNDVLYVYENNLMNGTGENAFSPNAPLTRGMLVTILHRAAGSPEADPVYAAHMMDVVQGAYYEDAMGWAVQNGILSGYGEGFYGPNDNVTREQFVTILYHYVQFTGGGFEGTWAFLLDYADRENIAEWAYEAACWCTVGEIITGKPGNLFDPQGQATRAEAAAMLHRLMESLAD